jgi:hypothetical protein
MCQPIIDNSLINLFTILISGAGVFAILLKYNVPELNHSFWEENPYAIKRDIIESVMTWIFMFLALFGLLIQSYSIIYGDVISERLHNSSFYIVSIIGGAIFMVTVIYSLGFLGKFIARKKWLPIIVKKQAEVFNIIGEIIRNDGFLEAQLPDMEGYSFEQRAEITRNNYGKAKEYIAQIEALLEIAKPPESLIEKHNNVSKYFIKTNS